MTQQYSWEMKKKCKEITKNSYALLIKTTQNIYVYRAFQKTQQLEPVVVGKKIFANISLKQLFIT